MIRYSQIIARLKAQCPIFGNRVGASVAFGAALVNSADLAVPHCFVMPVDFKDHSALDYDQTFPEALRTKVIQERFSTVICLDNSINRGLKDGGKNSIIPLDMLGLIQKQMELAFSGWRPDGLPDDAGQINLYGGEYADSDNKLLWYSFEWAVYYKRGTQGLPADQQEIVDALEDDLSDEDNAMMGAIDTYNVRNNISDPDLQPVAQPLEDSFGTYPEGPVDTEVREDADEHLDAVYEQVVPPDHNCTDQEVEDSATRAPIDPHNDDHKGIETSETE